MYPFFQKFYTYIAYLVLYFISEKKIIKNASYFKIIPPSVVKKIKKNTESNPYWNYLFTKHSTQNKIVYYVRKKRIHGSSKFNIFTLNPWRYFFSGIYFFKRRFINIILWLLIINSLVLLLALYNFYNVVLILFLTLFSCFLIISLVISSFVMHYIKKNKRIYCKYK